MFRVLSEITPELPADRPRYLMGVGRPQDISATCGFLCSEESSFITGQMIGVNAGHWFNG